jgi:PEP-CTERM motif
MLSRHKLMVSLALALFAVPASADSLIYVSNGSGQFGTLDLTTGAFNQIGPNTPEAVGGLVPGRNGSLFALTASGNLASINPATGVTSVIGPTGLGDCSSPASPCGPASANNLARLGETIYATDWGTNLYTVNPATGAATLIGPTGIPAFTANPYIPNPDGSFNFVASTLFAAEGTLYSTFGTLTFDPSTAPPTTTPVTAPNLYQIDPTTGVATLIAPTDLNLTTVANVNGTVYAFNALTSQVFTLDLTNGNTRFVSDLDPATGVISGATPVPEPASLAFMGLGIAAMVVSGWRHSCKRASAPRGSLTTIPENRGAH